MKRTTIFLVVLGLAGAFLAGHVTAREASLGTLPEVVIRLYDAGAPDGVIEIEADRDGTILEAEVGIAASALPESVLAAAEKTMPGGEVTGGEYELTPAGEAWEVRKTIDGKHVELVMDAQGTMVEKEVELAREEAPAAVMDAATACMPGATFQSVELVENEKGALYHVKLAQAGATYKVILAEDGTIRRRVREAKAEIEIPLP